jgi:CRISPR-associated endonuclease Cas1
MSAPRTLPQVVRSDNPAQVQLLRPHHGVITLRGYGSSATVDRGHLILRDSIAGARYKVRLARIGHELRRLVIIGSDGFVSLAALRWLADQKAAFVMLERDGSVLLTTGPVQSPDSRLRRGQALAHHTGVAIPIIRYLLEQKLVGQERIARCRLNTSSAAEAIEHARAALQTADTVIGLRAVESQAALAYWSAWQDVAVPFPKADLPRVPRHWRKFGSRRSQLSGSPRLAVNPPNSILNLVYSVAESESRLAAATLGLDPGLGFLHRDLAGRDSLACDLMEPIRPQVDAYVLDLLARDVPLRREWFFEQRDGNCRLMGSFVALLADTAPMWARAVAPVAERVAQMLWTTVQKPTSESRLPARLTQRHRRQAHYETPSAVEERSATFPTCPGCGTPLKRRTTRCAACESKEATKRLLDAAARGRLVAHSADAEARRAEARRRDLHALSEWNKTDQPAWLTEQFYQAEIQPRLRYSTLSTLSAALNVSRTYASNIRAGRRRPHPRHWISLAKLVGIASNEPTS